MVDAEFAKWVLVVVGGLVVGGVVASIKTAVDVAVIKQILREGAGRMDRLEAAAEADRVANERRHKRHSERLDNLESK